MEKDSGWALQKACKFSAKASFAERCMYCVHDNTLCDNSAAQADARNPVIEEDLLDLDLLDDLLEEEDEGLTLDEYCENLRPKDESKSEEDSGPKITLPDPLASFTIRAPGVRKRVGPGATKPITGKGGP
jgi:hypothetical protein